MNSLSSSPSSYETTRREIYNLLDAELELKNTNKRFAPRRLAESVFSPDRLARLFHSLGFTEAGGDSPVGCMNINTFIEITRVQKLQTLLAVLIYAAATEAAVKSIVTKTWKDQELRRSSIVDEWKPVLLPLSEPKCLELFNGDTEQTRRFRDCQPIFCTVVIRKHHPLKLDNPDDWKFPYLEEEGLGIGSFGSVFKVKIAAGHIREANGASHDQPTIAARKDYLLKADINGRAEHKILDIILSCRWSCPNLVESFGSVEWVLNGRPHYSLFMPLANYDLEAYMTSYEPDGPGAGGIAKKAEMLLGATGLAEGLRWLHYEMRTPDRKRLICYHMDLKPSNILLFEENGGITWKLSDFGMSRVYFPGEPKKVDFDQPFIKREGRATPKTQNLRGEGTYLAPETRLATPQSGPETDLWSLGAIVSTLFTYLEFGAKGINEYENKRLSHRHADGLDCFFLPPSRDHLASHRKHPEVEKWHGRLKRIAKQRNEKEGAAVEAILNYVEKSVFVIDSAAREKNTNAGKFVEALDAAYHAYDNFDERTIRGEEEGRKSRFGISSLFRPRARKTSDIENQIYTWPLNIIGCKGCAVSFDGTLVAFWTNRTIHLCTDETVTNRSSTDILENSPVYSLDESDQITWRDVVLTRDYLIASTSSDTFECYIFDLTSGGSVERALDRYTIVTYSSCTQIEKLALSDDDRWFACITFPERSQQSPGRLRWILVQDLVGIGQIQSRESSQTTYSTSSSGRNRPPPKWFPSKQLYDRPATIKHLTISTRQEAHIVVQPELSIDDNEHGIIVFHFDLEGRNVFRSSCQADGLNQSQIPFFTMSAPLNTSSTFALITRRRQLWLQSFDIGSAVSNYQEKIPEYDIFSLIPSSDDKVLYAFATQGRQDKVVLLQIPRPVRNQPPCPEKIAVIPGFSIERGQFAAAVLEGDRVKHMVIANMMSSIIKVRLPA